MKNLLAYTPEPFDNLEVENFEYAPLAGEMDMEEGEAWKRRQAVGRAPRRFPPVTRKARMIKPVRPGVRLRYPLVLRGGAVNVFPPADDRRPSGQSSSSGNAGGEGSFGNAPAQDVSSEHVRWVQETLNRALGLRLIVDGIMNRETRSAVRMFQERKGLSVTGLVGPDTEEALRAEGRQAAAAPEPLEGEWEMEHSAFCTCPSCGGKEMDNQLTFEAESFMESSEFEELEALDTEAFEQWQEETQESLKNAPGVPRLIKNEVLPPTQTLYIKIDLGIRDKTAPMTGIFIPQGYMPTSEVDIILYLHGFTKNPLLIADYWNRNRFAYRPLREGINESRKNVILVAPTLGTESQTGLLTRPGGLDAFLNQILTALHAYGPHSSLSAQPTIGNLILACHSGGGWPMRQLTLSNNRHAANIRECWGFDCTYNRGDDTAWAGWARSRPNNRVFIYYLPKTRTQILSAKLQQMNVPNAIVRPSNARAHEWVPVTHWAECLRGAAFLRDIGGESNEAEWEMQAFRLVPVENPGGGRIRDKRAPSNIVVVSGYHNRRIPLHPLAAQAWQALVNEARADGIKHPLLLPVSGYRSPANQAGKWKEALKKYGSPEEARKWVAPPGHSAHQSGRAVDCYLGGSVSSSNVNALRITLAYKWLAANAARFGFYPYDREPWHWEYNPPSVNMPLEEIVTPSDLSGSLVPPADLSKYRKFRLTTYHIVDQHDFPTGAVRIPIYDERGRKIAEGSPEFFAKLSLEGSARLTDNRLIGVTGKRTPVSHDEYAAVLAYHRRAYAKRDKQRREEGRQPISTGYSGIRVESDRVVEALSFHEVPKEKYGIGYGIRRKIPLKPFRTLAADIGHIKYSKVDPRWKGKGGLVPPGTRVYIKEYDGLQLPDKTIHDGWFIVNDTGGGIFGAHFDVFTGTLALRNQMKKLPSFSQVWFEGIEQRIPTSYAYGLKA